MDTRNKMNVNIKVNVTDIKTVSWDYVKNNAGIYQIYDSKGIRSKDHENSRIITQKYAGSYFVTNSGEKFIGKIYGENNWDNFTFQQVNEEVTVTFN